ncbi:MAG: hypothetical protein ACTHLT_10105 [Devosia sp.]
MNKLFLALAAVATLTSISTLPASAQTQVPPRGCAAAPCPGSNGGGGGDTSCDSQLGHLRQVMKPEVAGVDDGHRVWVTELCPSFSMMRTEGNAAYLRPTIARNAVLVNALMRKDYRPEDVFAVQMMGDDTINLYVHHFDR